MRLQIVAVLDRHVGNKERLELRVMANTQLSYYVVLHTRYSSPTSLSRAIKNTMWLPPVQAKAGDTVVIFTGPGLDRTSKNPDGSTTFVYYWGMKETIWNAVGDCAVVMEVATWQTTLYEFPT